MHRIDVLIPVYNTAPYLEQCFRSLQQQSFTDWRAIVVEDCSTDGKSARLCDEWGSKDPRIEVHHLPENKGISYVRQVLVGKSSAPLIAWLDSDDFLASDHLSSLVKILDEDPSVDLAMSAYLKTDADGKVISLKKSFYPPGKTFTHPYLLLLNLYDHKMTAHLWKGLYKRELYHNITFPSFRYFEDYAVMPELLANAKKMRHTGKATYFYRQLTNSIVHTTTPEHEMSFFRATLLRCETLAKTTVFTEKQKKLLHCYLEQLFLIRYYKIRQLPDSPLKEAYLLEMEDELRKRNFTYKRDSFLSYKLKKHLYSFKKRWANFLIFSGYR